MEEQQETSVPLGRARRVHGLAMVMGREVDQGEFMDWTTSDPFVLTVSYDSTRSASTHDVLFVPRSPGTSVVTARCLGLSGATAIEVTVADSLTMIFGELVDMP